jgi:hypothetical protein
VKIQKIVDQVMVSHDVDLRYPYEVETWRNPRPCGSAPSKRKRCW